MRYVKQSQQRGVDSRCRGHDRRNNLLLGACRVSVIYEDCSDELYVVLTVNNTVLWGRFLVKSSYHSHEIVKWVDIHYHA